MKNPLSSEKTFAYFGLMLGTFPPLAFFLKFITDTGSFPREEYWLIGVFLIVNLISAVVGFFSGKYIGRTVREMEKLSWTKMILTAPFVGLVWGIIAGGAGGAIIFLIGAIFGAMLGGIVGAAALPAFVGLHRLMKKGDLIEQKHFFPMSFGITFTICSFILGL
jgi:MFS family permease